jgi:hypothetical protein
MARMTTARKLLLGLLGGGGGFSSPLSIPGLALWYDGDDATTLFQNSNGTTAAAADGDPVGYWGNKASSGQNAIQATAGKRPTLQTAERNGKNIVRFAGTDDTLTATLSATLSQPVTVWVVALRVDTGFVFSSEGGTFAFSGGATRINAGAALIDNATTITNWNVYTLIYNGAASVIRSGGAQRVAGDAGAGSLATNLHIGSNLNFNFWVTADIAEIIVAATLPSAALIAQVETYLSTKWGF